ncbi:MAG TPA: non-homologous end-joining DNA ligase [Steroidobacteraceae bacterium]|jgi:bifunctional non-homologous end joining protein LigD|nr:non-homologous end-joining DNA ligase [Steroidobacteraceae bacterium]
MPKRRPSAATTAARAASRARAPSLTHPERLLLHDPPVTKQALADLYRSLAPHILPGLINRPLMLLRCPDGDKGECFFQKHAGRGFPPVVRQVSDRTAGERWMYVDGLDGLIGLVQMNTLELHVWGATVADLDAADRLIIDMDPAPGVSWKRVVEGARELRSRLERFDLQCFVRTSGGKGLHVVVPLNPALEWDRVRHFARSIAEGMAADDPQRYLAVAAKEQRAGKIFLDYLRNARGATAVCSYSLRARPGAPLATPLTWEELARVSGADQFRFDNILEHLARRPAPAWQGFERVTQSLPRLQAKAG